MLDEAGVEPLVVESRNAAVRADFVAYCEAHPEERFWQALRNWVGAGAVLVRGRKFVGYPLDTFDWEGVDK